MLKELHLTHFRNYTDQQFSFDQITAFIGANGVGKTNILEAISFLALGRSWRTRQDREVIQWEEEVARIVGQTDTASIEIGLSQQVKGGKLIKINGTNRRAIDLLGQLTIVLFLPESLGLVDGPPHIRRQFLDLLLVQGDRRYAYHLVQLQKVLRQRNRLLRRIDEGEASVEELAFWNESLVEHGSYLIAERVKALQAITQELPTHYATMSQKAGDLTLHYKAAAVSESAGEQAQFADLAQCPNDPAEWGRLLALTVERHVQREIAAGASLYGPQRDDFSFWLYDRPLASFGSRGEYRSAVLALKAAEANYLLKHRIEGLDEGQSLIFLLDDVYSELDEDRRRQLTLLVGDHQAAITTTDLSHLDQSLQKRAKVIEL